MHKYYIDTYNHNIVIGPFLTANNAYIFKTIVGCYGDTIRRVNPPVGSITYERFLKDRGLYRLRIMGRWAWLVR